MNGLYVKTNLKAGGINCDNCLADCQKGYDYKNRSEDSKINFWNKCSESCLSNRAEDYAECVNLGYASDICDRYLCPSNPKPR